METYSFLPVIVGTNINAYNMAISFYDTYRIKPVIVGRATLPFTAYSNVTTIQEINPALHTPSIFVAYLQDIAAKYAAPKQKLLLIGTDDLYVEMIIDNQEVLAKDFTFNYISKELMEQVYLKKNFYKLCEKHGLDTPRTYYYDCKSSAPFEDEVMFPVIIKPSDGVQYYRNPFEGLQKIYKVESHEEINRIITMVKKGGYQGDLIIQDYIPGDDTFMWDAVYYGDQHGKGQLISFAQVALQEHEMTAIGNYTALLTRYNEEMMQKLVAFCEEIGYKGFGNFDLKYDERDGKFKVFEVNVRQGRSSYYIDACGYPMASMFVDDLVNERNKPLAYVTKPMLFTVVPKVVLKKYVKDPELQKEIRERLKAGEVVNPLFYKYDTNFKRKLYLAARQINYVKKYRSSNWQSQ